MSLFSCDVGSVSESPSLKVVVERMQPGSLSPEEYQTLVGICGHSAERARELEARFESGCDLWLGRLNGDIAGYGWTVAGHTMEPHFFKLRADEVHFYDFHVFPDFRGKSVNVNLVIGILNELKESGARVAHIECADWNEAQLRSLRKTPFVRNARASKVSLFGYTFVMWWKIKPQNGGKRAESGSSET